MIAVCATCLNFPHSALSHKVFFVSYDAENQTTIIFKIQFSFDMTPCYVITRSKIDFCLVLQKHQSRRCHIPDDLSLLNHRCENLKCRRHCSCVQHSAAGICNRDSWCLYEVETRVLIVRYIRHVPQSVHSYLPRKNAMISSPEQNASRKYQLFCYKITGQAQKAPRVT